MAGHTLLAGWSSIDITPSKKVSLQGQYHERISEGVHDPIYATALAIEFKRWRWGSKAKQTFAIQLSCGSGAYLPTKQAVTGGSYGANVSNGVVGPEGGDLLVEHSVVAINSLWGEKGYLENWRFGG